MSGSDWVRHSKNCCKTPHGNLAVILLEKYRAGLQLLPPQGCEMCSVIYQEQKKWWENVIITIRVLSRLTALLRWAACLGWTFAVTCCNMYSENHVPVVFTLSCAHRFCSFHHSNCISFIWNVTRSNSRIIRMAAFAQFCLLCLTCTRYVMHILPLPLCGLHTILLTLVAPRGVTDLRLSRAITCFFD